MRKRVAFRAFVILLASALLLTSTGAYNILVFADQNMESSSLSANDESTASVPSVTTHGGEMVDENISLGEQSTVLWVGLGTEQSPFEIGDTAHLIDAYNKINNISSTDKYFCLTADINIAGLTISDFHDSALGSAAYLLSAEGSNHSAVYFKLDGRNHKIFNSDANAIIDASGYQYFGLFGFMNENCEVKNLTIENIRVNLMNARSASFIAFKNSGSIQNVTVSGCTMNVSGSTSEDSANSPVSNLDGNGNTGNDIYHGFSALAADNRGVIRNSAVNSYKISVNSNSDYVGGLAAQNRGSVADCSVSRLKITVTASNAFIGGLCGFNASAVTNCTVDLSGSGSGKWTNNLFGGRYVGGLIGKNDGALTNSLVSGSLGTTSTPTSESYDMCAVIRSDDAADAVAYYYGGAVAGGSGTIARVTVQNVGFYMSLISTDTPCYFGGITAAAQNAGAVVGCVSTGAFVSSEYSSVCYAGGVVGYAPADAQASALQNCYTLFRLANTEHYLTGAVVGFGGNEGMLSNCYWSGEISGCVTAYAIPNASDRTIIEKISDRSKDLSVSERAVVARRNTELSVAEPTHSWSGASASFSHSDEVLTHTVQGVVNSLDSVPYQQTMTLSDASIGYSGLRSIPVDFKWDVFVVLSDNVGDPDNPNNPFRISSSGMIRFLYLAPYANYVLTQDVTIDETEWQEVAFSGQLSGSFNNVTHAIYAPRRVFSAVVGSRAAGVAVDETNFTTAPASVPVQGGSVKQVDVRLTPDYFVLEENTYNRSVFGSLFSATVCSVSLTNETSLPAVLSGSRQGVFADAAYRNSYIYGCSSDISVHYVGTESDVGAFIGYLDNSGNVVDNCIVDADIEKDYSATNVAGFIGNIADNNGYVLNSIVITTVPEGVGSVFGQICADGAQQSNFRNIYWSRNSYTETSVPVSGDYQSLDELYLWGTSNPPSSAQYYVCNHTLNSGDARIELSLPHNIEKMSELHEKDFTVTRLSAADATVYYQHNSTKINGDKLALVFSSTADASDGCRNVYKVTHTPTGLTAYVSITAQNSSGLKDDDGDGYLEIKSAADLKNLSDLIYADNRALAISSFELCDDIDMSYFDGSEGRVFHPIGTASNPFSGAFVGDQDADGNNLYTISNVTVIADNNVDDYTNNGLFGVVKAVANEDRDPDVHGESGELRGIEAFNLVNIRVIGGDNAGALIGALTNKNGSLLQDEVTDYPIRDICVTDSTVLGGSEDISNIGRHVGGLIGEVDSTSASISGIRMNHVDVTSYFYDARFSNKVAARVNEIRQGYFTPDYFVQTMAIGGVIGTVYSEQEENAIELNITDTHVDDLVIARESTFDEDEEAYATMDAGGIVGSALNSYFDQEYNRTMLNIGSPDVPNDVTVTDTRILSYGNTGGIIGASDVVTILTNCLVSGSDEELAPEKSAMQVLSRSYYYLGGIAGYLGTSSDNINGGDAAMPSYLVYGSVVDCAVENAYVASTEITYKGQGSAPMRNVAVGGIIGGGNGQGYNPDLGYGSSAEEAEYETMAPFVSGCTVDHSRIEGIVTGGIVGADAEIQYNSDDETDWNHLNNNLDENYMNFRDYITDCHVTDSQITTLDGATRVAGDCPSFYEEAALVDTDRFILASGVGGIMGTNVRFQYSSLSPNTEKTVLAYGYIHDTIIEYCSVDSRTTVESLLPYSNDTSTGNAAVGGVVGVAFTNELVNGYDEFGNFVLRYNQVSASLYNSAELSTSQDFNEDVWTEPEIKVGTGGMIGMVKGGSNGDVNQYQSNVRCFIPGIHVYTSIFDGRLTGMHALGGVIGVVNYATDYSETAAAMDWWYGDDFSDGYYLWNWSETEVPHQMISDVAVAGSISVSGSVKSEKTGSCYGGYVIGHISAGDGAYTFDLYNEDVILYTPEQIFCDIYYTSFGSDPDLLPFGFLNGHYEEDVLPLVDCSDYCLDVNMDGDGTKRFSDVDADENHYVWDAVIDITEGSGERFVIMEENLSQYNWRASNDFVAEVTNSIVADGTQKKVSIRAKRAGTVLISIPFVGYFTDNSGEGDWNEKEVFIPTGFKYESPSQPPLTVAVNKTTGVEYHLVEDAADLSVVGYKILGRYDGVSKEMTKQEETMAWHYALYNETGVIEFTEDMFAADGSFPGGITPIGTWTFPFTGTFETLPAGEYTFTNYDISYAHGSNGALESSSVDKTVAYKEVTLRNLQMKTTDDGVGASLFGNVSGADIRNFSIDGMTLTGSSLGNYIGAIASKAFAPDPALDPARLAPITIENVNLNHFDFSDADYIGGLVGGVFANPDDPESNTTASVIRNCFIGNSGKVEESVYSNTIAAMNGAGGLLCHSSQYPADISGCTVRDVEIVQTADRFDTTNLDNGAAGAVMAYSGTMRDIEIDHCSIVGEVVGGAVVRSYTSKTADDFISAGTYGNYNTGSTATAKCVCTSPLDENGDPGVVRLTRVAVKDSSLVGTNDAGATDSGVSPYSASGGILARVDADTSNHFVEACSVDEKTTIQAVNGVGGIVGCVESVSVLNMSSVLAQIGVTITDCTMDATLSCSVKTKESRPFNRGIGGVIGVFYQYSPLIFSHISGCSVGGTIMAESTAGGLVGSIFATNLTHTYFTYASRSCYFDLSKMAAGEHFISNCLVTTDFVKNNGESCFNERLYGVGVVLGHYDVSSSGAMTVLASNLNFSANNNNPFYQIMFSSANYPQSQVALYGFDSETSSRPCLNGVAYATDYCYDLNRVGAEEETSHFEISAEGYLDPAVNTRINAEAPNDSGMLELYSTAFNKGNDNTVQLCWGEGGQGTALVLNTDTDEDYEFDSASCIDSFMTNVNNGTDDKSYSFELSSVELADHEDKFEVKYDREQNAETFSLSLKDGASLNDKLTLTVCFVYSNGLRMSMDIFINVRAREYWRLDAENSWDGYTYYLLFNASDLAELQYISADGNLPADVRIIQCYDLFWTLSDGELIQQARAALKNIYDENVTIADVLGNVGDVYIGADGRVYTEDEAWNAGFNPSWDLFPLYDYLGLFVRPNPAYFEDDTQEPEISFGDYFWEEYGTDPYDPYSCSMVPMSAVVGDIGSIDYGVYGESGRAAICDPYSEDLGDYAPFRGQFISLKNRLLDLDTWEGVSTGVTDYGESFAIYGLELRSENVLSTGTDLEDTPNAGLFTQIADDAIISDVRFINPKISVINSLGTDCYAGVLAGSVCYMGESNPPVIRNVSVEGTGDGKTYVKAITRMNPASVCVGGLVGSMDGSVTMYSASVSGMDVVASCMANAQDASDGIRTLAGGIAGEAVDTQGVGASYFQNLDVADCEIHANRNTASIGKIPSYAGGMFGVMNASVDLLDSTDPETYEICYDPETGEERLADRSEVSNTVVSGTVVTTDYNYSRSDCNNTMLDIAGGVAAVSSGSCEVRSVNVFGSTVVGYDVAGGVVGQIENSDSSYLLVTDSAVGLRKGIDPEVDSYTAVVLEQDETDVLVVGASGTSARFNTAGGAVGNVQDLDSLFIGSIDEGLEGVDFCGTVGTYGYDNHNREAVAGGMIGSISGADGIDLSSYLDKIQIYGSTVQGEVRGFNRDSVTDMQCAGGAGGMIGKIACAARKTNVDDFYGGLATWLMNDCIMSAKVFLYNSVYGSTVDCTDNQRNRNRDTNVGKLIGRMADGAIVDSDCGSVVVADWWQIIRSAMEEGALVDASQGGYDQLWPGDEARALKSALRGSLLVDGEYLNTDSLDISDYIQFVYGSSYPQDIVLYGNHNLSLIDFQEQADLANYMQISVPYIDCNRMPRFIADREVEEDVYGADIGDVPTEVQAFMVSEGEAESGDFESDQFVYDSQQYTDNAFIPLQGDSSASTEHYKYFRFYNPVTSPVSQMKMIFLPDEIALLDLNGDPIEGASAMAAYGEYGGYSQDDVDLYDFSEENEYQSTYSYFYNAGVMTVNLEEEKELIGNIVLNFDYGIQMNSSFTSIEIEGDGSQENPYQITQPKHFYVMRALRSNNRYFEQMNNIDLNLLESGNVLNRYTTLSGFEPIGTVASPFYGNFNGNGYVISNLFINDESANAAGLFGCIGKNTLLENIHIEIADSLTVRDMEDVRTTVNGGIIGGNNTGGLVGIIKISGNSTARVVNCSVAGDSVVGGMNVGGLVGTSAGTTVFDNCFTSATTASYSGIADVGALLGSVSSGSCELNNCYTAGYAFAAAETPVETAVGGLVGRNREACSLTVNNCFVSATASGNTADEIGLIVGADSAGTVDAVGNTVAVLIPQEASDKTLNIVAPAFYGSGNDYESRMIGDGIAGADAIVYEDDAAYLAVTDYADRIAEYDYGSDAYSEAYRQLIAAAVKVDTSKRTNVRDADDNYLNQIQSESILANRGLLYPLTVTFANETEFGTSVYDMSDTVEYPMGMDLNLTGNGSDKNTDLLFETTTGDAGSTTKIYRNIFKTSEERVAVKYDGETYENGEIYYDYSLPYAVARQTVTVGGDSVTIARKILYPVADIGSNRYPVATARQLKAMTSPDESVPGSKFAFLKTPLAGTGVLDYQNRDIYLVNDIDLSATKFIPIGSYQKNFYGNGHVISNMKVETSSGSAAMFTELSSGKIFDLGLMGMDVVNKGTDDSVKAAMLVARMYMSEIRNCFAIGSVDATKTNYEAAAVGGLVGSAEDSSGTISNCLIVNCMVSGTVKVKTENPLGSSNRGASAAGLVGHTVNDVTIQNATVTTNVIGYNTYAVSGSASGSRDSDVSNVVFGGQMENTVNSRGVGEGVAERQHLTSISGTTVSNVYADEDLGVLLESNLASTNELAASAFVGSGHFADNGMASFGSGYYPAPVSFTQGAGSAFRAGARFAAAAIHLNYIGSSDIVSSVSAPCSYGETIGSARLSTDDSLGAYFVNGDTDDVIKVDTESMRFTKKTQSGYEAAPEVSGIFGAVSYSLTSPISNSYLVRTVNGVRVQKTFTLCYKINDDNSKIGDKEIITVKNVLNGDTMVTTGLAQVSSKSGIKVTTGTICENMLIQPESDTYKLRAYCDAGAGKEVTSVTVQPAYTDNSGTIVSNLAITGDSSDPALSSFTATSETIGAGEDSGVRYTHLLVTVNVRNNSEWGLQRMAGNWILK